VSHVLALKICKEPENFIRYKEYGQFINRTANNEDIQYQSDYHTKAGTGRENPHRKPGFTAPAF
jgi:hypothetical protein